jgi:acyl-CoA synthetase (NDP forming)
MGDDLWKYLFDPNSVAVIGASDRPGSWGFGIFRSLIRSSGKNIYPVNPRAKTVAGMKAYANVKEIPEPVDFAVIVIPAPGVPEVFKDCEAKGVRGAVIISGGFAEIGGKGKELENQLSRIAKTSGMRFIGPNTMGHADTTAAFSTLAWARDIPRGPLGLISQSGNYSLRIIETGRNKGLGFSKIIVTGNEGDLHLEDYLQYFGEDETTEIIIAYIEGLRDGRRFFELAGKISKIKPIIVIKVGGTKGAARAVTSHTGALAGSDRVYNAVFRQTGVIRVYSDEELIDVVVGLEDQPLLRGKNIGIMSVGGGLGVMTAEACEREGLEVPTIDESTIETLNGFLPPRWSHDNPVDMVGLSMAETPLIFSSLWAMMDDKNVDALLLLAPVARSSKALSAYFSEEEVKTHKKNEEKNLKLLRKKVLECGKPVFFIRSSVELTTEPETVALLRRMKIPAYPNPHSAAKVLSHLYQYQRSIDAHQG